MRRFLRRYGAIAIPVVLIVGGIVWLGLDHGPLSREKTQERIETVSYGRDARTGVCFAVAYFDGSTKGFAAVPCTPEVNREIERGGR